MNGMKDEVIMGNLKQKIFDEDLEVVFVTEAHLTSEKQSMLKKVFPEHDIFVRTRKKKKKNAQYQQRGGIVCIAQKDRVKLDRECVCDDVMCVSWGEFVVLCAYFVPSTSPFAKRNVKRMIELQQRVLESEAKNQKVILLTDANAWIGELPSMVSTLEGEYNAEVTIFKRTSEKIEINNQGRWFVSAMNDVDLIIVNGIRSLAKYTYDHPGREARSVVDFVAVNQKAYTVVSDLSLIDCRESLCTDHMMICMSVQVEHKESKAAEAPAKPKQVRRDKPVMKFLKAVTRGDKSFWEALKSECEKSLCDFVPINTRSPDEDYNIMKTKLIEAVQNTLKHTKPTETIFTASLKSNREIIELRIRKNQLFRKVRDEQDKEKRAALKVEVQKVNRNLKRKIRKAINEFKRAQVREIEYLEVDDCRRMWKELKALSGWKNKDKLSETVLDEKKQEVCGEGVFEVWKESFRLLGIEDPKDKKFDVEFGERIVEQQEMIREESFDPKNCCSELDFECSEEEVKAAVQKLKLAKAAGHDQIVAEILKKGGNEVEKSLYLFCCKVWQEEKLPDEWTKGIIFPIFKDGDKRDTGNYRGITLLSIVGKVYAQVINERLMSYCEKNKVLVEEQGGFRPHRGCPDQLFSLVEILQNRGKKGTFCCFIDVKKAFDRVFRAGLWQRVADEGVKGKMWRVLRSIYETVESCVTIDGETTSWFPIDTGVRQGCVLSPLLYALFINGLVKELNALGVGGVEIEEGKKVSAFLYADDIVLLADNRYALQAMLDKVAEYAKKWRFELNPKKSEVVVFGLRYAPRGIEWKLGEHVIKQVSQYKYLGIELTRGLSWRPYIKRIIAKAKRNMTQVLAMGVSGGFMSSRLANIVWMSLVRSILEYGCEIWGEKEMIEFEKLQVEMGKRILRCGSRMTEEVVRGELGWERQKARRDEMRLRYWAKIVRMDDDRMVKRIYRVSRNRLEREEAEEREIKTKTWCKYTKELMIRLRLEVEWSTEQVGSEEEWNELIRERIHEREQVKWRTQCLIRPKLRTYAKLKKELRTEPFLQLYHRGGIPELVKVRGGTNRLRIEQGRYVKEAVEERVCLFCDSKQVEDEYHFMLDCELYEDLRVKMWKKCEEYTGFSRSEATKDDQLNALIGDRFQPAEDEDKDSSASENYKQLMKEVMKYITQAMNRRRGRQQQI